MKIIKVIHGYPMRYNAGSEVYSQTLCQGLAPRHQVHVFTREEDPFGPDFRLRTELDSDDPRVTLHLVNNPRHRDRYRHELLDQRFVQVLDQVQPDVVHIGHLNHLSTSLVFKAAERQIPIIYTLHDYWVMCPRGQFMQTFPEDPDNLWAACDGQEDKKCAQRCYARYFGGDPAEEAEDLAYWTAWVGRRMAHLRQVAEHVDLFVAPARYLLQRYCDEFGLPEHKLRYLDYGFDRRRLAGRVRAPGEPFTFGYIGTHIPAKGIQHLITAFGQTRGDFKLRIWGRPRGQDTAALHALAGQLDPERAARIEWRSEYRNQDIVEDVFNQVDAIVVPSVWVENSPLVIHEAQQARVPVITANAGGMAEYVADKVNGLLFEHRDPTSLTDAMQRLGSDSGWARALGERGYLGDKNGDIPAIDEHVQHIESIYHELIARRKSAQVTVLPGPWRLTLDTNPDLCNLHCIMCEEHSPHSPLQVLRASNDRPRRNMPFALLERVVREAAALGLRELIPSTMGEPLLYDDFEKILALCQELGLKLNLTTNGTFPRLGAQKWAEKIVPLASDVKISWNGATAATQEAIMLGTRWDKVLDNVRSFIRVRDEHATGGGHRARVTFQLTFLETNVAELAEIVALAIELGVDRVKGHHLWAHFDQIQDLSLRRSPEAIDRWNQAVEAAQALARSRPLASGHPILLENIFPLSTDATFDLAPGGPCPFLGQEAWISAEGRFDPCCAPDAQRRTLGDFGNLHDQGFMEIWRGAPYRALTATYSSRKLCLGCNMRKPVSHG